MPILRAELSADIHQVTPAKDHTVLLPAKATHGPRQGFPAQREHSTCTVHPAGNLGQIQISGPHFLHLPNGEEELPPLPCLGGLGEKGNGLYNTRFLETLRAAAFLIFHHRKVTFVCEISGLGQRTGLPQSVNSSGIAQTDHGSRPRRTQGLARGRHSTDSESEPELGHQQAVSEVKVSILITLLHSAKTPEAGNASDLTPCPAMPMDPPFLRSLPVRDGCPFQGHGSAASPGGSDVYSLCLPCPQRLSGQASPHRHVPVSAASRGGTVTGDKCVLSARWCRHAAFP